MADSSELDMLEMQAHLQMRLQTVARRIVESARLAAAMHLYESPGDSGEWNGQRVAIGGAGPVSPAEAGDSRLPHRPPCAGVVTDDESPAPTPPPPGSAGPRRGQWFEPAD
jgi:hypothetical protein